MSQEISFSVALAAVKDSLPIVNEGISALFDMSGDDGGSQTQVIGTSDELLTFPADVTTARLLLIWNTDPTNYVQLSYTSGGGFSSFSRLDAANGVYFGRPESTTIYAKANTGACRVKWAIVEV